MSFLKIGSAIDFHESSAKMEGRQWVIDRPQAIKKPLGSTLKCPVFIAHDLSGFAFPSALTEGARRATEVSAENRRAPSPEVTPCLVLDRSPGFRAGNPSAEKAATRCGP